MFPSVYTGVATALVAADLFSVTGPGVMIGTTAGVFAALVGPVPGFIFVASLIPASDIGISLVGIAGAIIGTRLVAKLTRAAPAEA